MNLFWNHNANHFVITCFFIYNKHLLSTNILKNAFIFFSKILIFLTSEHSISYKFKKVKLNFAFVLRKKMFLYIILEKKFTTSKTYRETILKLKFYLFLCCPRICYLVCVLFLFLLYIVFYKYHNILGNEKNDYFYWIQ